MDVQNVSRDFEKWVKENIIIKQLDPLTCNASDSGGYDQPFLGISGAEFVAHPPNNLRKSNFFSFSVKLLDINNFPIRVESASFVSFCDADECKNGVEYSVILCLSDQTRVQQKIIVRLLDSKTKDLVKFDGKRTDPEELKRVLVTHRVICSRCGDGKICGNENETPTDPILLNEHEMKFYLKCNQNCAKGPGNPSNNRRFQVAVCTSAEYMNILCLSDKIFVHNNSKHTKSKSFMNSVNSWNTPLRKMPKIHAISPSEGWTIGGQTIIVIGDNFVPGLHVIFGDHAVLGQLITSHAIRVQSPPRPNPGIVCVTLAIECHQYDVTAPGLFEYISPNQPSLEYGFSRLAALVPRYPGDLARLPKEIVLERAADLVEAFLPSTVNDEDLLEEHKPLTYDDEKKGLTLTTLDEIL